MNEYFISYYGCESCLTEPECPKACEKKLYYRCRIGNLTDDELAYFMKKVKEMGGFAENPSVALRYKLHSLNDIPLDSMDAMEEHIEVRQRFDRIIRRYGTINEKVRQSLLKFYTMAEDIRYLRPNSFSFTLPVDDNTAFLFFRAEHVAAQNNRKEHIERTRAKILWIESEMRKLKKTYKRLKSEKMLLVSKESRSLARYEDAEKEYLVFCKRTKKLNEMQSPLIPNAPETVAEHEDTSADKKRTHSKPKCAERDARIYKLQTAGKTDAEVCDTIAKEFGEVIDNNIAQQAGRRYAKKYDLDRPNRKRGRKTE